MNLLKDFDGVSHWILSCKDIDKEHVEILARHEVLRMCEGVGKILLRKPDEVISMMSEIKLTKATNGMNEPIFRSFYLINGAINFYLYFIRGRRRTSTIAT